MNSLKPDWFYWIALLILEDFTFYWLHRIDHFCRLFWAVHVTHHSSNKFNLTVGFRSSIFQPLYRFIYFIPLMLIGYQPASVVFVYSLTQIWGILVHTEQIKKLGWLEYIFVTPSHHRVHHGSNAKYLDKNLGMFLIIWDKLFGTFQPELTSDQYQKIKYGLTTPLTNQNAIHIIFHEWKSIWQDCRKKGISIKHALQYIFGAPGWSHDGSKLTSNELRRIENEKLKLFK